MGSSLTIRKYADRSGERNEDGSWPLSHVGIVGDPPDKISMSQGYALKGQREGWITMENSLTVYRPASFRDDPTDVPPHVFVHADAIVIHTNDRDIRYRVVRQPDKYADPGDDDTTVTNEMYDAGETRVDLFYELELEN